MSKATSGPWAYRTRQPREIALKRPHFELGQPNGRGLAIVFFDDDGGEANARLISAAPELLKSAECGLASIKVELALLLESHCRLDSNLEPLRATLDEEVRVIVEGLEDTISFISASIAKATGAA